MHGIGNDFVMVNAMSSDWDDEQWSRLAQSVGDRRLGIGSDGLIIAKPGSQSPFRMRMFNPDGSESEMCGNGIRCFAIFLKEQRLWVQNEVDVDTGAGVLHLEILDQSRVRVDMGPARLEREQIPMMGPHHDPFIDEPIEASGLAFHGTAVSMGNPHLVIFLPEVASLDLATIGPIFEHHPLFPKRTNVHFVQVIDSKRIIQRTWERGAGITLACGTGACASAVAAHLNGHTGREVTVRLPGGELEIDYRPDGNVFMTGPAHTVFRGEWDLPAL